MVGGGGDVQEQHRARERLLAGGRARLPHVLAHRQPDALGADVDDGAARARLEVALLVEHAVVGQVDLAVDRVNGAVGEHRGGVEHVLGALGEADHRDDPARVRGELLERVARVGEEVLLEQQVLGRVARDGELGEQHELAPRLARVADAGRDLRGVAGDVAHGGVHLAEREPHLLAGVRAVDVPVADGGAGPQPGVLLVRGARVQEEAR